MPPSMKEPDGRRNVLIGDLKDGHCRAILGYKDGELAKAVYCGEQTEVKLVVNRGRVKEGRGSWCPYHHAHYTQESSR